MVKKIKVFAWDRGNKSKNWQKHKVTCKECEEVFFNEPIKIYQDIGHSQAELRFVAMGITNENKKLFLIFTLRDNTIRVISARKQNRRERQIYEK